MSSTSFNDVLKWTLGLRGSNGKYFTAETFGNQLNVSGQHLRKKQTLTLEQNAGDTHVYFLTVNNKYLSAAPKGELTAASDTKGENEKFTVLAQNDGTWAIKSIHGYYLSGCDSSLNCFARDIGPNEKWAVHLAIHPQVCIRNTKRKTYVRLNNNMLTTDKEIPWGVESMVTLEFNDGLYTIRACNNKFLNKEGHLVDTIGTDCKFILEFFESQVAFRTSDGRYLQAYGPSGQLVCKKTQAGKDELFELEDSHPQLTLTANNGKFVSGAQTEDVKANQMEPTHHEIFQMEHCEGKWTFRNSKNKYWTVGDQGNIRGTADKKGKTELFDLTWMGPQIALKASNGKFVQMKPNGSLCANTDATDDTCKFVFHLVNRPQIVLRCEHGFLATRGKDVAVCNSPQHEVFFLEEKDGNYAIKTMGGRYLQHDKDTICATGTTFTPVHLELPQHDRLSIKIGNHYVCADSSGTIKLGQDKDRLWEY